MTTQATCQSCGAELQHEGVGGLCPKCLLAAAPADERGQRCEAPSIEAMAALLPYCEILDLIGWGGMGFVYLARQRNLDRLVAVKVLPAERAKDPEFRERFLREARTLATLSHPNIVTIYDVGETEDFVYFVMEYVKGASLAELIKGRALTPVEALRLIPQMCDALEYAHDQNVVHRDIKPGNILIDQSGRVKIADFGIAKLLAAESRNERVTRTGESPGTLGYQAPELHQGSEHVDQRADIYSLGVVIYEMLTGQLPAGHFEPASKKVHVDVRLDEVILRALDASPERRYQHAREVKKDVEEIDQGPAKRGRRPVWWMAAALLLLLAASALLLWNPPKENTGSETSTGDDEPVPVVVPPTPPPPPIIIVGSGKPPPASMAEALAEVEPGQTIRIHGTVRGPILLRGERHREVTLEGADGAILQGPPGAQFLIGVVDVSGVTIRNLKLRIDGPPNGGVLPPLIVAGLHVPGVALTDLEFENSTPNHGVGISLAQVEIRPTEAPLVIASCTFSGLSTGISFNGIAPNDSTFSTARPEGGILVIDNVFTSGITGISMLGAIRDTVVAGNRLVRCSQTGFQLQNFLAETTNLLIANNTLLQCGQAFRLLDDGEIDGDKSIRIINNLSLACSDPGNLDWALYDCADPRGNVGLKAGDGAGLRERWTIEHNFRESPGPPPDPRWKPARIRASPSDTELGHIGNIERDPNSPDFLRPDDHSPLNTKGAGKGLPEYVGAHPTDESQRFNNWRIPAK